MVRGDGNGSHGLLAGALFYGIITSAFTYLLGSRQVVRHRVLVPAFGGSSPSSPAMICTKHDRSGLVQIKENMKLEDIYYFSVKKQQHRPLFDIVKKVITASAADPLNAAEIQRRLELLTKSKGNEHIRQCANFVAEAIAFNELIEQGEIPQWVPENSNPTPDMQYLVGGKSEPVEVKHLNSPRDEHEALASGQLWGGSVDPNYDAGVAKKVVDFIVASKKKFATHNKAVNGVDGDESGILYLFFSKSIDADLTDGIEWQTKMEDRIKAIAAPHIDGITLIVKDLNDSIV